MDRGNMASLDHLFLLKEIAMSILIFLITHLTIRSHFTNRHNKLPPGPRGWPIIGALSLLGSMPHVTLSRMAKKYGPVMHLKMGTKNMVVASTLLQLVHFSKPYSKLLQQASKCWCNSLSL